MRVFAAQTRPASQQRVWVYFEFLVRPVKQQTKRNMRESCGTTPRSVFCSILRRICLRKLRWKTVDGAVTEVRANKYSWNRTLIFKWHEVFTMIAFDLYWFGLRWADVAIERSTKRRFIFNANARHSICFFLFLSVGWIIINSSARGHWFRSSKQVAIKLYVRSYSIKCDLTLSALSFYSCSFNPI